MKTTLFTLLAISCMMSCTPTFNGTLYRIQKDGLYGFIDSVGNVIIEPQYKYVSPFSDGIALVVHEVTQDDDDGYGIKYYYIDKQNKLAIDTAEAKDFERNDFFGQANLYFTRYDKLISWAMKFNSDSLAFQDLIFDGLSSRDGMILFQDENTGCWGYKNTQGQIKLLPIYGSAGQFCEERTVVKDGHRSCRIIDVEGNSKFIRDSGDEILGFDFQYRHGFIWTSGFNDYFLLDKEGTIIASLPGGLITLTAYPFSDNGYALVYLDLMRRWTYANTNGDWVTDFNGDGDLSGGEVFWDATSFSEGCASVLLRDGWVFIDKNFNVLSKIRYDSTGVFHEGYVKVRNKGGQWGYVDKNFNQVIPFRYSECGNFHKGLAYFRNRNLEGYINKAGEIVWSAARSSKLEIIIH